MPTRDPPAVVPRQLTMTSLRRVPALAEDPPALGQRSTSSATQRFEEAVREGATRSLLAARAGHAWCRGGSMCRRRQARPGRRRGAGPPCRRRRPASVVLRARSPGAVMAADRCKVQRGPSDFAPVPWAGGAVVPMERQAARAPRAAISAPPPRATSSERRACIRKGRIRPVGLTADPGPVRPVIRRWPAPVSAPALIWEAPPTVGVAGATLVRLLRPVPALGISCPR